MTHVTNGQRPAKLVNKPSISTTIALVTEASDEPTHNGTQCMTIDELYDTLTV